MNNSVQHQDRAYLRHPSEMPIRIHCEGQIGQGMRRLRDVSIGGLACRSAEPMEVGREVLVEIPFGKTPFKARGAVT